MGSVVTPGEANHRNPLVDQSCVLPGAEMAEVIYPAWKHEVVERSASAVKPALQCGAGLCHDFKLCRSIGLLLNDRGSISNMAATYQIADTKLYKVTSPELAIDRQVKQRTLSKPLCSSR